MTRAHNFKDETSNIYGRLSVIRWHSTKTSKSGKSHVAQWLCRCDCGNEIVVDGRNLRSGNSTSCGCYNLEQIKQPRTHGKSYEKVYNIYNHMVKRCLDTSNSKYGDYGGRGIKICDRWLEPNGQGFINFYSDMGDKPEGLSLDRIDVNGDYEPRNCRWATSKEQAYNKRRYKSNSSSRTGVAERNGKYVAYIRVDGKQIHLGTFYTFEDAVNKRELAELEYYGYNKE